MANITERPDPNQWYRDAKPKKKEKRKSERRRSPERRGTDRRNKAG